MTTTEAETTTQAPGAEIQVVNIGLPATVRCAACDAQAYVEVEMPSKMRLEFCAHHYTKQEDALKAQALRIIDHRPFLVAQEQAFKGQAPLPVK